MIELYISELQPSTQPDLFGDPSGKTFTGEEDCLVVNVYTTKLPDERDELRPVLLWFHGGGFFLGDSSEDMHGPERLMDHGIVLVLANYRLGVLSSSSTGDDVMAGNLGLWDQRAAMQWVRDNVGEFGGDPDSVTIGGVSAGSIFVTHHLLSPQSRGLFHGAIAQSGVTNAGFQQAYENPNHYTRKANIVVVNRSPITLSILLNQN